MASVKMTPFERRAAFSLAAIFSARMFGLFMILPVLALFADSFPGSTPALLGLAIGAYGLTQALLQIPFGMLSDRLGRKPVITLGLLIFALGSYVAATAASIEVVILGRILQGAGAIAAAVLALAADLTSEEHRTKAMGMIGASIGFSFVLAMILGPLLSGWLGIRGIFAITVALALLAIPFLWLVVPKPQHEQFHRDAEPVPSQFRDLLRDGQLMRLNLGVLVLHMVLTASFVVLPLRLAADGLEAQRHWIVYLPVMVLAMAAMVPMIIIAEKRHKMRQVVLGAITTLLLSMGIFWLVAERVWLTGLTLWLFFAAFNTLEASMPSLVSKFAPAQSKGSAMGIFSSSQFFGAFLGGGAGGWIHGAYGDGWVFLFCAAGLALWLLFALGMRQPPYLRSELLHVGALTAEGAEAMERELLAINGVAEVTVCSDEGVAYMKVDAARLDREGLERFAATV